MEDLDFQSGGGPRKDLPSAFEFSPNAPPHEFAFEASDERAVTIATKFLREIESLPRTDGVADATPKHMAVTPSPKQKRGFVRTAFKSATGIGLVFVALIQAVMATVVWKYGWNAKKCLYVCVSATLLCVAIALAVAA
jgi:hypothetical protein